MSKVLSKNQMQIIMLLNLVLVFLFVGIFITFKKEPMVDAGAGLTPTPHSVVRSARVSANQNISWETNIGGSKDDSVVNVLDNFGRLYIFGNTQSTDFDFAAGSGGFMAQVTYSGNTKSFVSFSFNIVKAIFTPQGFIVVGNEGNDSVFAILNSDGVVINKKVLPRQCSLDFFIYKNQYFVVTQFYKDSTQVKSVMLTGLNMALEKITERIFTRAFSLTYVTIFPHKNSFALICNANTVTSNTSFASILVFNDSAIPAVKDITLGYNYTVAAAQPYDGGIAFMCSNADKPEILLLDKDFNLTYTKHFPETQSTTFNLFFNNNAYFTFVAPSNAPSKLYKMDSMLSNDAVVSLSSDFTSITSNHSNSSAGFIAGKTANSLKILALSKGGLNFNINIATADEQNAKILPLTDGIIVVAQSNKKSADVGGNFGESDVWVAKLPFPEIFAI